jgi:hypothetical protein
LSPRVARACTASLRQTVPIARPHIEFIQQQDLPFVAGPLFPGDTAPDVRIKRLSADAQDGSSSNLVQFPAGWRRPRAGHLPAADLEVYLLSGDLSLSGTRLTDHTYAFLPAGSRLAECASEAGATALVFLNGRPSWQAGEPPPDLLDRRRVVPYLNLYEAPWTGNFHPQFPMGAGRKWLRRDPVTTEESWILATFPLRHGGKPEKHPVVEEMYLVAGEVISPIGVMRPGAYFWRPPEIWHGPYGSKTGSFYLFRTLGGPLSTVYTEDEQDFDWNVDRYAPIVPAELDFVRPRA